MLYRTVLIGWLGWYLCARGVRKLLHVYSFGAMETYVRHSIHKASHRSNRLARVCVGAGQEQEDGGGLDCEVQVDAQTWAMQQVECELDWLGLV